MKKIAINIGNKGVILSIVDKNKVDDKLFIEEFNPITLSTVVEFFNKYNKYDAYIVLDTVSQNYNYKLFPNIGFFNLLKVVNRKFAIEIPKKDLKKKKFLYKDKNGKFLFLFISASVDTPLREWLLFFNTIPNNLLGIYMVPLELVEFSKNVLKANGHKDFKDKWILTTINNNVSDFRQVAIFNNQIAFTRLLVFEESQDLATIFRNDISRTIEYIKRFDPDFNFEKLTILNILDAQKKEQLNELNVEDSIVLNYTPYEISQQLNLCKNNIEENEKYTDLLMINFILNSSKKNRFGNLDINLIYNISFIFKILKYSILGFSTIIVCIFLFYMSLFGTYSGTIRKLHKKIEKNSSILRDKSNDTFGMDAKEVDKIINVGSIIEIIEHKYVDPMDSFQKFHSIQSDIVLVANVKWNIDKFDYQSQSLLSNIIKMSYNVSIINPDGDPNKLFYKYDQFSQKLKETYKNEITDFSTLPSNINFSKKYLTYPLKIEISERK